MRCSISRVLSSNLPRVGFVALLAVAIGWPLAGAVAAPVASVPVSLAIDSTAAGPAIGADYSGLSYEVRMLLPGADGSRYFRPDRANLIALFHTLGIGSLRIGGNTSDRDARELPATADLDSAYAFAKAAGVKVIYCLRLRNGNPADAVATVKYIMDHYAPLVDSFSIGQEPSAYPVEKVDKRPAGERMGVAAEKFPYTSYRDQWKVFAQAIIAAVPNVKFCGPSVHNNGSWADRFMADFGHGYNVTLITEHLYAGGAAQKLPSAEVGRERMLSDNFTRAYQKLYDGFVPQAKAAGLPYRLEETNSYFNGGALGSSNTYASALWGLDYMYWWAEHGAAGLNFHTGDRVSMNNALQAPRYAAFISSADGFEIRPLAYALKAFAVGGHGHIVPVKLQKGGDLNLTAYATTSEDGTDYITVINREFGEKARAASLSLAGLKVANAAVLTLKQASNDVAATAEITLGSSAITGDGKWDGKWEPLAATNGAITLTVGPASAVIVRIAQ